MFGKAYAWQSLCQLSISEYTFFRTKSIANSLQVGDEMHIFMHDRYHAADSHSPYGFAVSVGVAASGVLVACGSVVEVAGGKVAVDAGAGVSVGAGSGMYVEVGIARVAVVTTAGSIAPGTVGAIVGVAMGGFNNSFSTASRPYLATICGTPPGTNT